MVRELAGRLNAALVGRYAIEREIGQGGMAIVFLADDLRRHRRVALKVLHPELAESLGLERFLREIEIAGRLTHPNILTLLDSGEADGLPFYVMPYVDGESLRDRLSREGQLSLDDAGSITRDVAEALAHAHSLGVIHRDIKPENILLQAGRAFVADFGVAHAVSAATSERLTLTGIAVGSPAYMSPEQSVAEHEIDARSDIYSLACVLYEMLAGAPPYTGPTAQAVIARRMIDPVPPLRTVRPSVSVGLEHALTKALSRVPADRFPSVMLFAQALTAAAEAHPSRLSIAVLPFLNLSADPDNAYFADGITEDVIAQLCKIRALKVISRNSVMGFRNRDQPLRDIAARLDVATLLDGSVRRVGDRVRIVAQLLNAATDQTLWVETYDRQLTDVFAIQSDVALQIAHALRTELTPSERARIQQEPTNNVAAYQLYLMGRQRLVTFTAQGIREGITYFERALEEDRAYALAHASIALGLIELGESGAMPPDEAYRQAAVAASRALALDPNLAEGHCAQAYLRFVSAFDWTGAESGFRRALELSPNSADALDLYGRMLTAVGRHDEALTVLRRAGELDPLVHRTDFANTLLRAGRYDEALMESARTIAVDPAYDRGHATLAWAYLKKGLFAEGLAELEQAVALAPGNTVWLAQLGQAKAMSGDVDAAREVLRRLEELARARYISPYHFAYVYTGLGEHERALDWLERAFAERAGAVYGIKSSFLFDTLRAQPRFVGLLHRMNLA